MKTRKKESTSEAWMWIMLCTVFGLSFIILGVFEVKFWLEKIPWILAGVACMWPIIYIVKDMVSEKKEV